MKLNMKDVIWQTPTAAADYQKLLEFADIYCDLDDSYSLEYRLADCLSAGFFQDMFEQNIEVRNLTTESALELAHGLADELAEEVGLCTEVQEALFTPRFYANTASELCDTVLMGWAADHEEATSSKVSA